MSEFPQELLLKAFHESLQIVVLMGEESEFPQQLLLKGFLRFLQTAVLKAGWLAGHREPKS